MGTSVAVGTTASVAIGLVLLTLVAVVAVGAGRISSPREVVIVVVRAVVQLLVLAGVIKLIFETPLLAPVYLSVMLVVASRTSSRRLRSRGVVGTTRYAAAAIAAGAGATVIIVAGSGALPVETRQLVPFAAQVIGGAMTATTLASVRMLDDVAGHWDEVEGWLAIGATPSQAVAGIGRRAAGAALVPALDQTRNVGLVVLPGAFVGLLLAGATPLDAGRLQVLVLVGLLCAESIAALVATILLGRVLGNLRPEPVT